MEDPLSSRKERVAGESVLAIPVLLLNRFFAPVSVIPARRAMLLLYTGSALALDATGQSFDFGGWRRLPVGKEHDRLEIVNGALRVPRVLHLLKYDRTPQPILRLTRRNLLIRDQHQCQYCGRRPGVRELNIDHVLPRSRGGPDSWENLVISCRACNLAKGRRTPEEAGMRLLRRPNRPRWSAAAHILLSAREACHEWNAFLGGA